MPSKGRSLVASLIGFEERGEASAWYLLRGLVPPPQESLPPTGFIVSNVAAGYLYQTDSTICILEGFITNPRIRPSLRNHALDIVTMHLIHTAKERGFKQVIIFTQDESIQKRASYWGFKGKGRQVMMSKELK